MDFKKIFKLAEKFEKQAQSEEYNFTVRYLPEKLKNLSKTQMTKSHATQMVDELNNALGFQAFYTALFE